MNTFAILEVGATAYDEISKALKKAGYSVERDGEINMEGIHLKRRESPAFNVRVVQGRFPSNPLNFIDAAANHLDISSHSLGRISITPREAGYDLAGISTDDIRKDSAGVKKIQDEHRQRAWPPRADVFPGSRFVPSPISEQKTEVLRYLLARMEAAPVPELPWTEDQIKDELRSRGLTC